MEGYECKRRWKEEKTKQIHSTHLCINVENRNQFFVLLTQCVCRYEEMAQFFLKDERKDWMFFFSSFFVIGIHSCFIQVCVPFISCCCFHNFLPRFGGGLTFIENSSIVIPGYVILFPLALNSHVSRLFNLALPSFSIHSPLSSFLLSYISSLLSMLLTSYLLSFANPRFYQFFGPSCTT